MGNVFLLTTLEISMSSDLIKHVTDATFEAEVLKAQGPVLVDYWLNGAAHAR